MSRCKPSEVRCGPRGYAKCNGGQCKVQDFTSGTLHPPKLTVYLFSQFPAADRASAFSAGASGGSALARELSSGPRQP